MKLTDAERDRLKDTMIEFTIRVLNGRDCTPQETATLPAVLGELFDEDRARTRAAAYSGNQWS